MQGILIDQDLREELKRSKRVIGELYPIIVDKRTGNTLVGNHRKAAGWRSVRLIDTKDEMQALQIQQAGMIQHGNSMNDHLRVLRRMCELAEKAHGIQKQKVGKYVVERISMLRKSYAYQLIPNEYKMQTRPHEEEREGKIPLVESSSRQEVQELDGTTFRVKPTAKQAAERQVCPMCHGSGYVD